MSSFKHKAVKLVVLFSAVAAVVGTPVSAHGLHQSITIDIKPGSDINPLNAHAHGVLPVAILGSDQLNVEHIEAAGMKLSTVSALGDSIEDVNGDGYPDLVLKFDNQEVVSSLGPIADGEIHTLELKGTLKEEYLYVHLTGTDTVSLISN